jgi:putative FmdB family regulatory protein|tara:strand:+ start:2201 stop:2434 length:234 start_codon:yes stop_codon:yes gene_type:complete
MPTYNYRCTSCDHIDEDFRHFSERAKKADCTECGSKSKQTFSTPVLVFDGTDEQHIKAHKNWVEKHETAGNGVRTYG